MSDAIDNLLQKVAKQTTQNTIQKSKQQSYETILKELGINKVM